MSRTPPLRSWAEIDLAALRQNVRHAQSLFPDSGMMAVVKADAYGHGILRVSKVCEELGATFLGVANCGEARSLQAAGRRTPIYVLGPTFPDEREEIVRADWRPCVSSQGEIDHFQELAAAQQKQLAVHLALDTGMGRGGYLPDRLDAAAEAVAAAPNLLLEGIGSHLPSPDEDVEFTTTQLARFQKLTQRHKNLRWLHIANSAGSLAYPQSGANLIRPGLCLYGASPLPEFQDRFTPVMSLKSRVSIVRTLPKGHGISYGRQTILEHETPVATVGIGYGDGYPRAVSGKGSYVFLNGKNCPILGRVTMDQIMIDVTHCPETQSGDEVELFGKNIPVSRVAQWAGTIPWEVFTGITPRVTRVPINS